MISKEMIGGLSVLVGLAGFVPYFWAMYKREVKPHVFTWFTWGLLAGLVFAAQWTEGGGAGAWNIGIIAFVCFLVAVLALFVGEKNITRKDWVTFVAALIAIPVWWLTDDPVGSVILATLINFLAFLPTFFKSYHKPREESLGYYVFSTIGFVLSIWALEVYNLTTVLYPGYIVVANIAFAAMVLWRRRILSAALSRSNIH